MTPFIATSPVDLIAVAPFAIGFHPEDSVVLLTFGDPAEHCFHARFDLPVVAEEQRRTAARVTEVLVRRSRALVAVLLYTEDAGAAVAFHDVLMPLLEGAGIEVVDAVRVTGETFHAAADPEDPGTAYDLSTHPFTAASVVSGRVAHDSREALADTLVGADDEDRASIAASADRIADQMILIGRTAGGAGRSSLVTALATELRDHATWLQGRVRAWVADDARPRAPLSAEDAGRLLVLVALESLREVAIAEMTRERAGALLDLWRDLTRRAPGDLLAGTASLCAFAAWLHGEGALAWCAVERCLAVDPDDALAQHVAALLEGATPPALWAPVPSTSLRVFRVGGEGSDPRSSG
jgi:hypothetical protein